MNKYTVITISPDFELRTYASAFEVHQPTVQHIEADTRHDAAAIATQGGSDYVVAVIEGFVDPLPATAEALYV